MFLRKIKQALERMEENQRLILAALEGKSTQADKPPDEWVQQGIDNIMSYQVGKKIGGGE